MNPRFHCRQILLLIAALCVSPFLFAQDGVKGALFQTSLGTSLSRSVAVADLDGDNEPDGAILINSQRVGAHTDIKIELHFSGRSNTELNFESTGQAFVVRAWDIDHDGANDLVVEDAFTHKPLYVWINEGHGDFHQGNLQDFPLLAFGAENQLQSPSSHPECLFCLPPQGGFEISVLTLHLLGRPPSTHTILPIPFQFSATSLAGASQSTRAPPLLS